MKRYDVWLSVVMGAACSNGRAIGESGLSPFQIYENRENLKDFGIFTEKQVKKAAETTLESTDGIFAAHVKNKIQSVNFSDEAFPKRLRGIYGAPVVLFYKGDLSLTESKHTVSIVGSRHCDGEGEKACRLISGGVAERGGVVISGLARGIDGTAHKSCIDAGGKTVAFVGMPLDKCFPKSNEKLQKIMEKDHLVISEYYSGFRYYGANFVNRNRLIAAAGDALCVIQAKEKSGSLSTVERAEEYGKQIFTVPGGIFNPNYEGTNAMIISGRASAVTNGGRIMSRLGAREVKIPDKKKELPQVSDFAAKVLESINGAMFTPRIVKSSGLPAGVVKAAITELEISGYIRKAQTGEYIRRV